MPMALGFTNLFDNFRAFLFLLYLVMAFLKSNAHDVSYLIVYSFIYLISQGVIKIYNSNFIVIFNIYYFL